MKALFFAVLGCVAIMGAGPSAAQSTAQEQWNALGIQGRISTSPGLPPAMCADGTSPAGFACSSRFCTVVYFQCRHRGFAVGGGGEFTRPFSEERKGVVLCPKGKVLAGMSCEGSYCDNVALYCVTSKYRDFRSCIDTNWISEENDPIMFPAGYAPVGMRCDGSYCDNKSFRICKPA